MERNQKECCRVCLSAHNLTSIFGIQEGIQLAEKIMFCASVQISKEDSLPSNICQQCLYYLDKAYIFKSLCEWTDTKLHQKVQNADVADSIELILKNKQTHNNFITLAQHSQTDKNVAIRPHNTNDSVNVIGNRYSLFPCVIELHEQLDSRNSVLNNELQENDQRDIYTELQQKNNFELIIDVSNSYPNNGEKEMVTSLPQQLVDEEKNNATEFFIDEEINIDNEVTVSTNVGVYPLEEPEIITNDEIAGTGMGTEKVIVEEIFSINESFVTEAYFEKALLVQNKSFILDEINSEINNSIEHKSTKDQNVSDNVVKLPLTENMKKSDGSQERVGRHIAKKNAGQPPKRYSPDVCGIKRNDTSEASTFKKMETSFPTIEKINSSDVGDGKKMEMDEIKNIFEESPILEHDLPMPEPIFEESVVAENYEYPEEQISLEINEIKDNSKETEKHLNSEQVTRSNRKKCKKSKRKTSKSIKINKPIKIIRGYKKINIFDNQTTHSGRAKIKMKTKLCKTFDNASTDDSDSNYSEPDSVSNYSEPDSVINVKTKQSKFNKRKNFRCEMCNKTFPFYSHIVRHLQTHSGVKQYTCDLCNKQFINKYNLSVHKRKHTGKFPIHCGTCGRGFSSPSILKRHERSHSGETPFHCKFCFKQFAHSSSLHLHEKMHVHKPTYACDVCSKVFTYSNSLLAHKRTHSGHKAFACNVCHKSFTRNTSLVRHMCSHSQENEINCRICKESFLNNAEYLIHLKVHAKYKCENCDLVFATKNLLVKHCKKRNCFVG